MSPHDFDRLADTTAIRPGLWTQLNQGWYSLRRCGPPMNNMTARLETVRALMHAARIERVIETGTFIASTTRYFAKFAAQVETIELNPYVALRNGVALHRFKNVKVHSGNSTEVLRQIIAAGPNFNERVFFYLDAHWNDYLPLRDEVELVFDHYRHAVILIDDFQVPGDSGYGFDDYGPDKQLTLDYLRPALRSDVKCYFPTTPGVQETGAKRGYIYLSNDPAMLELLEQQPLLKRHDETFGTATRGQRRVA